MIDDILYMYVWLVSVGAKAPFGSIQGQKSYPVKRPGRAFEGDLLQDHPMQ